MGDDLKYAVIIDAKEKKLPEFLGAAIIGLILLIVICLLYIRIQRKELAKEKESEALDNQINKLGKGKKSKDMEKSPRVIEIKSLEQIDGGQNMNMQLE